MNAVWSDSIAMAFNKEGFLSIAFEKSKRCTQFQRNGAFERDEILNRMVKRETIWRQSDVWQKRKHDVSKWNACGTTKEFVLSAHLTTNNTNVKKNWTKEIKLKIKSEPMKRTRFVWIDTPFFCLFAKNGCEKIPLFAIPSDCVPIPVCEHCVFLRGDNKINGDFVSDYKRTTHFIRSFVHFFCSPFAFIQ